MPRMFTALLFILAAWSAEAQSVTWDPVEQAPYQATLIIQDPTVVTVGLRVEFAEFMNTDSTITIHWSDSPNMWDPAEQAIFRIRPNGNVLVNLRSAIEAGATKVYLELFYGSTLNGAWWRFTILETGDWVEFEKYRPYVSGERVVAGDDASGSFIPVGAEGVDLSIIDGGKGFFYIEPWVCGSNCYPAGSIVINGPRRDIEVSVASGAIMHSEGDMVPRSEFVIPRKEEYRHVFIEPEEWGTYVLIHAPDLGSEAYAVLFFQKNLVRLVVDPDEIARSGLVLPGDRSIPTAVEASSWGQIKAQMK